MRKPLLPLLLLPSLGCIAQGQLTNGHMTISYEPVIAWEVKTSLRFNASGKPLVEVTGDVEAEASTPEEEAPR